MPLEDFVTPDQPLGPIRHEVLGDDIESAAALTSNVRPYERVFKHNSSMIIGRKGSGKTSVIKGYRSLATYGRTYGRVDVSDASDRDLFINVIDWGHFHELVRNVASKASKETDFIEGDQFILPERLAEIWSEELWDLILQSLHKQLMREPKLRLRLPSVVDMFEKEDISPSLPSGYKQEMAKLYTKAITEAERYFESNGRKCFILIDSMDEYPIRSRLFARVVSGFLKCINDFGFKYRNVKVIFCLPEELLDFFNEHSSNFVKDFSAAARLDWRPSDLLRMVAERYRVGLLTITNAVEPQYKRELEKYDFASRDDLQEFFSSVLRHDLKNSLNHTEDTLAYIIRHTQLLPREFLLIFNRAVRKSKEEIGSWRYITDQAIRFAVESTETELAHHILRPYEPIYPQLLRACESVMPELPPICTMKDLDRIGSRFKSRIEDDIYDPWKTLYDMGVLGYVEEDSTVEAPDGDRYVYGYFKYNSTSPISFKSGAYYCVHPLFSRRWSMTRTPSGDNRCVYPANIEHFRAKP